MVVVAARDYPAGGDSGSPIEGIEDAESDGAVVFHAATALRGDQLVTNGGRILNVAATGATVAEARAKAYAAAERIRFEGARFRRDVALEAARERSPGWLSRSSASSSARSRTASAMQGAFDELDERGVAYEFEVRSAHRTPDAVAEYARTARSRGLRVLICGAGLSAALPGAVSAHTDLPVIGVPLRSSLSVLDGLDALLAIAQMPPGVPVAAVGVDNARNAAALAVRILGVT